MKYYIVFNDYKRKYEIRGSLWGLGSVLDDYTTSYRCSKGIAKVFKALGKAKQYLYCLEQGIV